MMVNHIWSMAGGLEDDPTLWALRVVGDARVRSCVLGRGVLIQGQSHISSGTAIGLDERGSLIVRDSHGHEHVLNTGEISLRLS
jgi:biotin-(acetyl-CoA carboxylase) ligase